MKSKQIFPPTYLLASIIATLLLHLFLPIARIIPAPWNLLGIVILIAGAAVNVLADNLFHQVRTTVRPFEESTTLVTTGLYRFSRNPMYLGFNAVTLASMIYTSNWIVIIMGAYSIVIYHYIILGEEKFLAERFGEQYSAFRRNVRRYL
jgi:protein-S-isoprenylcysteine O-methyltransferase Ste14